MPTFKSVAIFCLKCATFSLIFWSLWLGIIRPLSTASSNESKGSTTQDAQSKAQMQAYDDQMIRTNRMLDVSEDQQKRMDQYLAAQEANAKRFDAILQVWEKQTGLRK